MATGTANLQLNEEDGGKNSTEAMSAHPCPSISSQLALYSELPDLIHDPTP